MVLVMVDVEQPSNSFNILVLCQYDHKRGKPTIIDDFIRLVNDSPIICGDQTVKASKLMDADEKNGPGIEAFKGSYWARFCHQCSDGPVMSNFAVAFFTEDDRDSCAAGNLFLEVGYWLGLRGDHDILIVFVSSSNYKSPVIDCGRFPDPITVSVTDTAQKVVDELRKRLEGLSCA